MALNPLQRAAQTHLTVRHFSPEATRMSDAKWCERAGITERTLTRWKSDAEFREALQRRIDQLESCSDPFALLAREYALEQMLVQYEKERGIEKRQYLNLIIANTVHVVEASDRIDYDAMTDAELVEVALDREIPLPPEPACESDPLVVAELAGAN